MSKIRVALRVRPLSVREEEGGFPVVVAVEDNSAFITDIRVPERPKADSRARYRQFQFDHAFWLEENASEGAAQSEIYREMGPPLEKSILQGYNACLLAYGQSGTGKTHTMLGSKADPGIIPRLCHNIWDKLTVKEEIQALHQGETNNLIVKGFRMEVSFMEIYREKVRDLLSPAAQLKLREHPQHGPHVQNLSRVEVTGEMGLLDLLWEGECRRAIGTTGSNRRSSRSHAIWTIYLTRYNDNNSSTGSSKKSLITNQVHLVDLAGSEKAGFTTAKNLLAEGADINRSLVALGNVISSLAEKTQYIPYRDSALTWLLKDSLGGNATTAIIITASPASCCHAQTLNSFRFAQRARLVENKPRINLTSTSLYSTNGGVTGSAALYSVMSAFEVKKDISRLSKIIRSAQNNGGLLRGLTPKASWTRLVNALEGWNQIEAEQIKLQREASVDTSSSVVPPTSSDAMIQADLVTSSEEPSTASSSKQSTPSRLIGTEVFIPCSNSIKCLTWQQEQTQIVPKPPPPPPDSDDDEYCSFKLTPPATPTSSSKLTVHHLKYLLPVQFPVNHHLDHASRISEKIHRSFSADNPPAEKLEPVEVPNYLCEGDSPLIKFRERIPTLVDSKEISPVLKTCVPEKQTSFHNFEEITVPIRCKSVENCVQPDDCEWDDNSESSSTLNETCIPLKSNKIEVFERIDSHEITEQEIKGSAVTPSKTQSKYRMVNKNDPKRSKLILKMPPIPPQFSVSNTRRSIPFEEISPAEVISPKKMEVKAQPSKYRMVLPRKAKESEKRIDLPPVEESFYFNTESILPFPSPSLSSSSSSSTNPFNNISHRRTGLVQVIPEESEENDLFQNESISDLLNDLDLESDRIVTTVCMDIESENNSISQLEEENEPHQFSTNSQGKDSIINGATNSKFRNHFSREFHQMEKIGKQLKQLQQMSQRFNVVKPFLDQIEELHQKNHAIPDSKLDAEVESCSGWNVEIEFQKVNSEINSLNKILKTGIVPSKWNNNCPPQRRDSTTTEASSSHQSTSTIPSTSQGSPSSPRVLSSTFGRLSSNNNPPKMSQATLLNLRRLSSSEQLVSARSSHSAPTLPTSMTQQGYAAAASSSTREHYPYCNYQGNLYGYPEVETRHDTGFRNAHGSISYPHSIGNHHQPYGVQPHEPSFVVPPGHYSPESIAGLNEVSPPFFQLSTSTSASDWRRVHSVSSNESSAPSYQQHPQVPLVATRNSWTPIDQMSTCSSYQPYHQDIHYSSGSISSGIFNEAHGHFGGLGQSLDNGDCHEDFCSCNESLTNLVPNGQMNFRSNPPPPTTSSNHLYSCLGIGDDGMSSTSTAFSSNDNLSPSRFTSSSSSHYGNMFTSAADYSSANSWSNRRF